MHITSLLGLRTCSDHAFLLCLLPTSYYLCTLICSLWRNTSCRQRNYP
nr:MAG TPA: hypothetical protein [Caudoviricetes sp.]